MTSRASDFDYPDLPDSRDDPTVRGDTDYSGSFENQKQELAKVWNEPGTKGEVLRQVFLTNLVRLGWRRYSFEQ